MKKKLTKILSAIVLICAFCAVFMPTVALAEGLTDSLIVLMEAGEVVDNQVEIVANLARNSGVINTTISLDYDDTALTLVSVEYGKALSNLSHVASGTFSTKPFKINYLWNVFENDYSKGVLLTLVFEIKQDADDGEYKISLNVEKNGVEYLEDTTRKYKNLIADSATVTVKGGETIVNILPGSEYGDVEDLKQLLTPVGVATGLVIVATVVFIVVFLKRKSVSKGKNTEK